MSKANPYIPAHLDDAVLARDMRVMANRLDAQADRFGQETEPPDLAGLVRSKLEFRHLASSLRLHADQVQPDDQGDRPWSTARSSTGSQCAVCIADQFMTKFGITCPNGHGGADSVLLLDDRRGVAVEPTVTRVAAGPPPPIAAVQSKLDEHARQRRKWRLAVEDFEVRNTPRGMRCAIAEDLPDDVSFDRPKVRYLQPDEQPPLGQCWTVYPVNDGQGPWAALSPGIHKGPAIQVVAVEDGVVHFKPVVQQPRPAAAPAVCGNCDGTGQTYGSGGGPACLDCGGSGRRKSAACGNCDGTRQIQVLAGDGIGFVSMACPTCERRATPEPTLDEQLAAAIDKHLGIQGLTVEWCSLHHLQVRNDEGKVELDWWPTTGTARASTSNGVKTSTHRDVATLVDWLKSL